MSGFSVPEKRPSFSHVRAAFTLVEMLVVMGIFAILLAATVPAFRGFNQGGTRRAAVSNLMGVLERARMMAVSDGLPTYVVFACRTNSGSPQVNPTLWGRAYAIFQDNDNVTFTTSQRTAWLYLPESVAFKVDGSNPSMTSVTNQTLVMPTSGSGTTSDPLFAVTGVAVPSGSQGPLNVQLPYWKFDSTGAVDQKAVQEQAAQQQNSYLRLLLFTGYVNANGDEKSTQNTGGTGNTNVATLEEIDVNPVTGRARYVVDPLNNLATPTPTPGT